MDYRLVKYVRLIEKQRRFESLTRTRSREMVYVVVFQGFSVRDTMRNTNKSIVRLIKKHQTDEYISLHQCKIGY